MSAPLLRGTAQLRRYAAGIGFIVVIASLVYLSIAIYTKAFVDVVMVELKANRIGNQLTVNGDVKLRGIVVGEVREVSSTGSGATIRIALDTDQAPQVPADVSARLLPKTLFGEKEVVLVLPERSTGSRPIREGDVIPQDRSETSIETERVLNDFLPLLRALKPAELSMTLNALSGALRGRGDRLGRNLALNATYFRELNPQLPALLEDFRGLADLSNNYDRAAPDFLRLLDNFSAVARNTVDQREELNTFLSSTATFSTSADDFLRINERSLIELARSSRPSLEVYKRYSPEFPCMLRALTAQTKLGEQTFGGRLPGLHITLEVNRDQGAYVPGDEPQFKEDRGPTCFGLTGKPIVPFPAYYEPKDGYCDEEEAASPGVTPGNCREGGAPRAQAAVDPAVLLGGPVQRNQVGRAVGPVLELAADDVPDIATLLFGPVARGGTVSYLLG